MNDRIEGEGDDARMVSDKIGIGKGILYAAALIGVTTGTLLGISALSGMEHPPIVGVQRGFRGTAMEQVYNPRTIDAACSTAEDTQEPAAREPDWREGRRGLQECSGVEEPECGAVHPVDGEPDELGGTETGLRVLP